MGTIREAINTTMGGTLFTLAVLGIMILSQGF